MPPEPTVLIMAAGRGTRMRSSLPKVLHPVCGKPMVEWVIEAARGAGIGRIVCITRPGDGVADGLPAGVELVEQTEGEGTGSAVLAAAGQIDPEAPVLVLSGDHPLLRSDLIADLLGAHSREGATATLLTTESLDPSGYGRIVRAADNSVERIVETKHTEGLSAEELALREINLGTYVFGGEALVSALAEVGTEHGERYLTSVLPVLRDRGERVATHLTGDVTSAAGVNDRADLMGVEEIAQRRILEAHAAAGVTFEQPATTLVEAGVELGEDVRVAPGVTLRGATSVGPGSAIGPYTSVLDAKLGAGVTVVQSHLVECEVRDGATVGPFAYLRPGALIREDAKVGTFVEVKNSDIGAGTKVPHLSYIGDADVGEGTNIGAGNITANYDGQNKHRTTIGDRVKTSVDTAFVAPVTVGDDAYTGAGSVITEDVPDGALGIARSRQENVEGYAERKKKPSE
jgi:bifunctional UDP-N-acetylglucosamine pyrophosphorylase / glucosamine-1-phosphate N-acetyltransferase